ncbi:MAG: glycosyltransferase family 39 protein [Candidatus Omnitrophica bacterium]|nr:glycosyltransferase family 39 protein [Candidatus Omnitrophota bacterium]
MVQPLPELPAQAAARTNPLMRLSWWGVLAAIVVLAVWLRWTVFQVYLDNESLFPVPARAARAMQWASEILGDAATGGMGGVATHDDPGYALLVALFWGVSGVHTAVAIQVGTLLCDLLALVLLSHATRRVFGPSPGLIVGALYAVYMPIIIEGCFLNNLAAVVHFAIFAIWLLAIPRASNRLQFVSMALAGLVAGLASVVRVTFLLFPVPAGLLLLCRDGWRKGGLLALTFWMTGYGAFFAISGWMGGGAHTFWHSFHTGLGDFPNPLGIGRTDLTTFIDADETARGTLPYQGDYDAILKARSLMIVADNPGFYLNLLAKRTWKVLFGQQDWWILAGFGVVAPQLKIITWSLFSLCLVGIAIVCRHSWSSAAFLILGHLYFALCVVPVIVYHSGYYLTASVLQLPFAALALSRLCRLFPLADPSREHEAWRLSPLSPRPLLGAVVVGTLIALVSVGALFLHARRVSGSWKQDLLQRISSHAAVSRWGEHAPANHLDEIVLDITPELAIGDTYLAHVTLDVERGRIATVVEDATGKPCGKPAYTTAPGLAHCLFGWTAKSSGSFRLRVWDSLPIHFPAYYDELSSATLEGAFRHFGILDHAKFEFFPNLRVEASASNFPNGHESLPFKFDKIRWSLNETQKIPNYWATHAPCHLQLTLPHEPTVCRLILHLLPTSFFPPVVTVQKPGGKGLSWLEPLRTLRDSEGGEIRYDFVPTQINRLRLSFLGAEVENRLVSIRDVSIPDPARFRLREAALYHLGSARVAGYPTRLSFLEH